jgi:hypothetical protein
MTAVRGPSGETTPARVIDLREPLSLRNSFAFPLQSRASRRDLWIGGLWLFVPVVGWLMNMGHRVVVVHRLQRGETPWPAWENPGQLLRHGVLTFAGMVWYGWPGVLLAALGAWLRVGWLAVLGGALWALAVVAIPGFMSHYCRRFDPAEIFDPRRALRRVAQGGVAYWRAWAIVLPAMLCSFAGLLAGGVGFAFSSVWFWQAAAFSFASVFTQRFDLDARGG